MPGTIGAGADGFSSSYRPSRRPFWVQMKTKTYWVLALVAALASCSPAPAPAQAWKTLDGIAISVDTAMRAANDMYQAGRLNDAQKNEIIAAHDLYRPIARAAHAAIRAWAAVDPKATTVPDNVSQRLADATAAAKHVVQVAQSHGVKP